MIRRNFIQALAAGVLGTLKCVRPLKGAEAWTSAQASVPPAPAPGQVWLDPEPWGRGDGVVELIVLHSVDEGYDGWGEKWHGTPGVRWWQCHKHGMLPSGIFMGAPREYLHETRELVPLIQGRWRYLGHVRDLANSVGGGG